MVTQRFKKISEFFRMTQTIYFFLLSNSIYLVTQNQYFCFFFLGGGGGIREYYLYFKGSMFFQKKVKNKIRGYDVKLYLS